MTPNFENVPEHWRHPLGPYMKAPAEFGGRWWLVNPFVGIEPWRRGAEAPADEELPPGFAETFGQRPRSQDYHGSANPSLAFRVALGEWEQQLRHFVRAGYPGWAPEREWGLVLDALRFWGLGDPRHYEGRYGWMTRFPKAQIPDYEASTWTTLNAVHLVIAQYQLRLLDQGIVPTVRHPFVPPAAWPGNESSKDKEV